MSMSVHWCNVKTSRTVIHRNLGEVVINSECLFMQATNPDPTTIYVQHDGDIKEVSRNMIKN
jgi:hypothetical protein